MFNCSAQKSNVCIDSLSNSKIIIFFDYKHWNTGCKQHHFSLLLKQHSKPDYSRYMEFVKTYLYIIYLLHTVNILEFMQNHLSLRKK